MNTTNADLTSKWISFTEEDFENEGRESAIIDSCIQNAITWLSLSEGVTARENRCCGDEARKRNESLTACVSCGEELWEVGMLTFGRLFVPVQVCQECLDLVSPRAC